MQAVNASSPQSYVHARCSGSAGGSSGVARNARKSIPPHGCRLKVLLALANDVIQQPLRFLVQSCFALRSQSSIIAIV
jgi:hypothetical protein